MLYSMLYSIRSRLHLTPRRSFQNFAAKNNVVLSRTVVEENQDIVSMDKLLKVVSKFVDNMLLRCD